MVVQNYYKKDVQTVLADLKVDPSRGKSEDEIIQLRKLHHLNELPSSEETPFYKLVLEQFEDKLVIVLLVAAVISFLLALIDSGEDQLAAFVEPAVILLILILNAIVGVAQETNANEAIKKLKESQAGNTRVLRDGIEKTVSTKFIFPGDIIICDFGTKIPADARIIECSTPTLKVDQSMLTGESKLIRKITTAIDIDEIRVTAQDKINILFGGTVCVEGKCKAVVVRTGIDTNMGDIADRLKVPKKKTPLQKKLDDFGDDLTKYIAWICIIVWLINIGHFFDPEFGGVFNGAIYYFKIAVALAVAAIPEGLPAVVTTCLALGTRKMAKKNAIVRHLPSVETLGCTTVICSDKTGTLTTNAMAVQRLFTLGKDNFIEYEVTGNNFSPIGKVKLDGNVINYPFQQVDLNLVSKISSLCNAATLQHFKRKSGVSAFRIGGAPTEGALKVLAEKIGLNEEAYKNFQDEDMDVKVDAVHKYWNKHQQTHVTLPFSSARKSMSVIVSEEKEEKEGDTVLLAKGAPKLILERCDRKFVDGVVSKIEESDRKEITKKIEEYSQLGLRCLGLSYKENPVYAKDQLEDWSCYPKIESDMIFVGVVAMQDPPRAMVAASIAKCRLAGIRVVVITGDDKKTAEAICKSIGLITDDDDLTQISFTGGEFAAMSNDAKDKIMGNAKLFSRVEPHHKQTLVGLLQDQGHVVAMTGDGVNDAPALVKADIGIAMGTGTDIAKDSASMILQDDNFATIVMAVEEGRAIYANTKQFIRYLISSNIGEVACIFFTAALGIPESLIPVQLLWVNLVTDGLPATALGFNPPDKDIMTRPPRKTDEKIIDKWMFFRYMSIGIYVGIATVLGFIYWYLWASSGPQITFTQLSNFHSCKTNTELYAGIDCGIFKGPYIHTPSTISLTILVIIEMLNALNALSENQSLLTFPPWKNMYVIYAILLSFFLHLGILYIEFFRGIFSVNILNTEEWMIVMGLSIPVILLDEVLKFIARKK